MAKGKAVGDSEVQADRSAGSCSPHGVGRSLHRRSLRQVWHLQRVSEAGASESLDDPGRYSELKDKYPHIELLSVHPMFAPAAGREQLGASKETWG